MHTVTICSCTWSSINRHVKLNRFIVSLLLRIVDISVLFVILVFGRMNLYELIKKNNFQGFSLALIRR